MSMFTLKSVLRDAASDAAAAAAGGGGGNGGDAAAQAAAAAAKAASGGDAAAQAAAAAAKNAPAPFFKGLYGDDGKIDKGAFDRLPDNLKPFKDQFSKYDTVEALLQGFGNAHSMAVKKALAPLQGNEPPEIIAERNTLLDTILGVPKDIKGYNLTREAIDKNLPEEAWDQEAADSFAALAQKHHLSPAAALDAVKLQASLVTKQMADAKIAETEYYTGQDRAFEQAMKTAAIDLDKANDLANRGAQTLGIDPKSPIFKNAAVRQAMVRFANLIAEDKLVKGEPGKEGNELDEARAIMGDVKHPMHDAWANPVHPNHERVKERVNELYRIDGERKQRRGT